MVTYWRCCNDKCGFFFKITSKQMRLFKKSGIGRIECPKCRKPFTYKTNAEAYKEYYRKYNILREKAQLELKKKWFERDQEPILKFEEFRRVNR